MRRVRHEPPAWSNRFIASAILISSGVLLTLAYWLSHSGASDAQSNILQSAAEPHQQCSDTCFKARDGVCDDGRVPRPMAPRAPPPDWPPSAVVLCDLGTDCADCGPWLGSAPRGDWQGQPGPVAYVRSRNKTLRVKVTATQPSFLMPITWREADPDVSAMLEGWGALEGGVTRTFHEILKDRCVGPTGEPALVLDVGAQFGYFALYAAAHGCRVIAWEPVPLFHAFLEYGAAVNNVTHLITVRRAAGGDGSSREPLPLGVPKDGTYWGLASINNLNLHKHEVIETLLVPSERVDSVVAKGEDVLLLKVDVEGYEPAVMRGASLLVEQGRLRNVLLEYSPGIPERWKNLDGLAELPHMLLALTKGGFGLAHLPSSFATPWPPSNLGYDKPMPPLQRISAESLQHDVQAALQRKVGCAVPQALLKFGVWNGACNEWAYWAHPKGFRSSFGYNTNLWASLGATQSYKGVASLFGQEQSMKVWSSQLHPGMGTGHLRCDSIGAGHRVLYRCNCTQPAVCGEEETAVWQLAAQGLMQLG